MLKLQGESLPFLSGEIHYFRHEASSWPRLLDALCDLGLTYLSSYVPWGLHELEAGQYDFGERRRNLAVHRFVELAGERDLKVLLRPGPHINAELTWMGFPRRVLGDQEVMARTPAGNPLWLPTIPRAIAIPSYASRRFLDEVDRWLAAVGQRLTPLQGPDGPLAALQLDNEAPLLFRDGPFDQDYHPDAVAAYAEYRKRLGRPAAPPPSQLAVSEPADLLEVTDWVEHKNDIFARALRRMRETLEGAGLTQVVYTHNLAQAGPLPPVSPGTFDAADAVGFDFYHQPNQMKLLRNRSLFAVGSCEFPFAAELAMGAPWNLPPLSANDSLNQTRAVLAYGLRGFNLFMAADRDRWFGAPIGTTGREQKKGLAADVAQLVEAFKEKELHNRTLQAPVALVVPRLYPRLAHATWTLGPALPPSVVAFGLEPGGGSLGDTFVFDEPIQVAWADAFEKITAALSAAHVGFVVIDGDVAAERLPLLEATTTVIALTYEPIESSLWDSLRQRATGDAEVVLGPRLPGLDSGFQPLEPPPDAGELRIVDLADEQSCSSLAEELASRPGARGPVWTDADGVEVTHLAAEGRTAVVGFVEHRGRRVKARLRFDGGGTLRDLVTGAPVTGGAVELGPYEARLYEMDGAS